MGWAGLHGSGNVVGGWCLHWCHWTCGVLGERVEAEEEPVAVGGGADVYAGAARNRKTVDLSG